MSHRKNSAFDSFDVLDLVPRDLSVIAVGPHGGDPCTLTTVEVPAALLGELAVEMVVDQLDGSAAPEIRLLPPRLFARASTSCPSTPD